MTITNEQAQAALRAIIAHLLDSVDGDVEYYDGIGTVVTYFTAKTDELVTIIEEKTGTHRSEWS